MFIKRLFIVLLSLFVAFAAVVSVQPPAYANTTIAVSNVRDVTMQPGTDEFSRNFAWYATSSEPGQIQLAKASEVIRGRFPSDKTKTFTAAEAGKPTFAQGYTAHHVGITGLEPNTEYVYRAGNRNGWSEVYGFKTGGGDTFSFLFAGDPQIYNHTASTTAWQNNINGAVKRWPEAAFIISGGDQIDGSGSDTSGSESHYSRLLSPEALRSIAFAPTLGNHDRAVNFTRRFNMPNLDWKNGLSQDGTLAGNYYYTYGHVLFIHLNSNNVTAAQHRAFMQSAIGGTPDAAWRIVVMHHAAYGVGAYANDASRRRPFFPLMDEFKIDVVLNGHDHIYSRSHHMLGNAAQLNQARNEKGQTVNPKGTVYITGNSASGSKFYASRGAFSMYNAFQHQSNTPNISKIDMTPDSFTINTYRSANRAADGEFILMDTYSIIKKP